LLKLTDDGQEIWTPPTSINGYVTTLRNLLTLQASPPNAALPEWTAFAAGKSKVLVLQDELVSPLETLSEMGRDFVFFRSWGKDGQVLYSPSEKNFKFDHDLMRKTEPRARCEHPERIVFGLPQNYGQGFTNSVAPADSDRRASPLFFHIHQANENSAPLGIVTYLPSQFLPSGAEICVGGPNVPLAHNGDAAFWKPAEDFLFRLRDGSDKVAFTQTHLATL
jgi:CRISPR-associated protein Cmr1